MTDTRGSDSGLERSLRDRDEQALAELFSRHRERLWRMVSFRLDHRLHGRVDPDDVLQESYLAASQRMGHYAERESMSAFVWLRLIVGQTLIDVHRRHLGAQMRDAGREVTIRGCNYSQTTGVSMVSPGSMKNGSGFGSSVSFSFSSSFSVLSASSRPCAGPWTRSASTDR